MQIRQEVDNNNSKLPAHFTNNRKKQTLRRVVFIVMVSYLLNNEYLLTNIIRIMHCSDAERVKICQELDNTAVPE